MSTTVKRITLSLTKEDERQLKALSNYLGENQSQAIQRSIWTLYRLYFPHSELISYPTEAKPDNPEQF